MTGARRAKIGAVPKEVFSKTPSLSLRPREPRELGEMIVIGLCQEFVQYLSSIYPVSIQMRRAWTID